MEGFGAGLTPPLSGPGRPETLKLKNTFLKTERCLAGCKLTWAAPGTSARNIIIISSLIIHECIVPPINH